MGLAHVRLLKVGGGCLTGSAPPPGKSERGGCCGGSCPRASPPWCPPTSSLSTLSSSPQPGAPQGFNCFGRWMLEYVPCLCISPSFRHTPPRGLMGASYRLFPTPGGGIGRIEFGCDKTGTQKTYQIFYFSRIFTQCLHLFPSLRPRPWCVSTHRAGKTYIKKSPNSEGFVPIFDTSKFPTTKFSHKYPPPLVPQFSVPRRSRSMGGGGRISPFPPQFYGQQLRRPLTPAHGSGE